MQAISASRAHAPDLVAPRDRTRDANTNLFPPTLIGRVAPAMTRTRRSRDSERYYVGRRPHDTEVYVVTGTGIVPLEHPGYQSDAAFDWGDLTAGALELAFAMLAHTTDSRPPDPICLTFWAEVVACLDRAGFVLADGDIALWLLTAFCEGDASSPGPPADRSGSLGSRAVGWFRSRLRRR
jgi:hypothetical protein